MNKILVIEDNVDINKAIKLYLLSAGYEVDVAFDGKDGLNKFIANNFDMAIVDMMLPGMSGLDLIKQFREKSQLPIIVVSAKGDEIDKIEGLSLGADDYITKPFSPPELLARVKTHMRRWDMMKSSQKNSISIGAIVLNTRSLKVTKDGEILNLTATEYKILKLLMENRGQIFSKKQICEIVNGEYFENDEKVIVVHISHLREKIECDGVKIRTIRGLGYKFE